MVYQDVLHLTRPAIGIVKRVIRIAIQCDIFRIRCATEKFDAIISIIVNLNIIDICPRACSLKGYAVEFIGGGNLKPRIAHLHIAQLS